MEKVVLAYSGGLDTSIVIPWLKENYNLEVIACCVNIGQDDDMEKVRQKAIKSGASKIYIEDCQESFINNYAYKALKIGAIYEYDYLLGTALARPLIGQVLAQIAIKEGAKYICHGCTGKGNDQVRFETAIAAHAPEIKIIAPWREWEISSREDAIDYALSKGIEVLVTKENIYSRDQNLWHISHEGGDLEYLNTEHDSEKLYQMVKPLEKALNYSEIVEIEFEKGIPIKLNNEKLSGSKLVTRLNKIAGNHGVGIKDIVENRTVGMKSRGIYETPAGTVLYEALKQLETIVLDKESIKTKQYLSNIYADLIYTGMYFTPLRQAIDSFTDEIQKNTTGVVKLRLYKGNIKVVSRNSKNALYNQDVSSFGASELYNHSDAEGFIKLFSLPTKLRALKTKQEP